MAERQCSSGSSGCKVWQSIRLSQNGNIVWAPRRLNVPKILLSTSGKAWSMPPSCSLVLKLPLVVSSRETMITVSLQAVTLWFPQKLTPFAQTMTAHCGIVTGSFPSIPNTNWHATTKKNPNGNLTNNCERQWLRQSDCNSSTLDSLGGLAHQAMRSSLALTTKSVINTPDKTDKKRLHPTTAAELNWL